MLTNYPGAFFRLGRLIGIATLTALMCFSASAVAAKLESVIELEGNVPVDEGEQLVWDMGSEHENDLNNSGELLDNRDIEEYLESIVEKLMGDDLNKMGIAIDFIIVQRPSLSAWVYPYGTIAVHTGLLANLENEAQLAAILAHEVAHFVHRHSYSEVILDKQQSGLAKGLGLLATAAVAAKTGTVDTSLMKSGEFIKDLVTNGYSRKLEYEADETGLRYMSNGNYSLEEGVQGFVALKQNDAYGATNMGSLWSSHPKLDNRIDNLNKEVKKAIKKGAPEGVVPDSRDYLEKVSSILLLNAQLDISDNQYDRARNTIQRYQTLEPDDPAAWYMLGEADRKESPTGPDFSSRIQYYQKAVGLEPEFAQGYLELGMALRQAKRNGEAKAALQTYLDLEPDAADAGIIRGYMANL